MGSGYADWGWAGMLDGMRQRDEPDIRAGDLISIQLGDDEPDQHVIVSRVERGPGGELVLETIPEPGEDAE